MIIMGHILLHIVMGHNNYWICDNNSSELVGGDWNKEL